MSLTRKLQPDVARTGAGGAMGPPLPRARNIVTTRQCMAHKKTPRRLQPASFPDPTHQGSGTSLETAGCALLAAVSMVAGLVAGPGPAHAAIFTPSNITTSPSVSLVASAPGTTLLHQGVLAAPELQDNASVEAAQPLRRMLTMPFLGRPVLAQQGMAVIGSGSGSAPSSAAPAATAPGPAGCKPLTPTARAQAYGDLGGYSHKTATQSAVAQKLIDQGLLLGYNYNQAEARRSFQAALEADPNSAMAYWGLAYAQGPFQNKAAAAPPGNYNYPVFTQQELEEGRKAIDKGLELVDQQLLRNKLAKLQRRPNAAELQLLERDKAYLQALEPVFRQPLPYGPDWQAANKSYAQRLEMWAVGHPDDADALALAAEAWANNQPWDFWEVSDPSQPKGQTSHILDLIRKAMAVNGNHPLAAHLLIHATEGSTPAGTALAPAAVAADMLGAQYPSMGHLVHMGSHTYLRVGRWHDALVSNQRALQVDLQHTQACLEPEMPSHDANMGVYAAMTGAEQAAAEQLAGDMATFPQQYGATYMSEGREQISLPLVQLRFGSWSPLDQLSADTLDRALDQQSTSVMWMPEGTPFFNKAMYDYVDVMRLAAKSAADPGSQDYKTKARDALDRLHERVVAAPDDYLTVPGTGLGVYGPGFKLVAQQAEQVAAARLAVLEGDWTAASSLLTSAAALEGTDGYAEPPRFTQPQGECLGWVLLKSGRLGEAASAYAQVLQEYPRSPWALTGLSDVHTAWEEAAQAGQAPPALPAGVPSRSQVAALLSRLEQESEGQAVKLPSSCPAFSVADLSAAPPPPDLSVPPPPSDLDAPPPAMISQPDTMTAMVAPSAPAIAQPDATTDAVVALSPPAVPQPDTTPEALVAPSAIPQPDAVTVMAAASESEPDMSTPSAEEA